MKRATLLILLSLVLVIASTTRTKSFVRQTINSSSNAGVAWNLTNPSPGVGVSAGKIKFEINDGGAPNVSAAATKAALEASFQTWQNIPTTNAGFTEVAPLNTTTAGNTGRFPLFWVTSSTTSSDGLVDVAGALAKTFVVSSVGGEILNATIVFNGHDGFPPDIPVNKWSTT